MTEETNIPEEAEVGKPKKKVGRPTREEAAKKALSKPGRRKGSKNKSSEAKEDEARKQILCNMTMAINNLARLSASAQSETVQANCSKWIVEFGLDIYEKTTPKTVKATGEPKPEDVKPIGKVFPFAVKQ